MEFKKFLEMISEESTSSKDQHAEKAGKKVAKDIEYDEDHKAKDDDKAEKAGEEVTKDIEYDDKKKKSLKDWFEHVEAEVLNEDKFQLPVVGPDGRTIAGQTGFLEVNTQGQDGVAINNLLRTLGGRHMKIILPPNRIEQTQQQQALQAAQRAAKQGGGRQVQEDVTESNLKKMKEQAPLKANDPFDAENNALKAITKNAGLDSKPLAFDPSFDKSTSIGSQPKPTALSTSVAPEAPAMPAPPAASAAKTGGMSDEERYGKVGAEIRRLDPEAYKNRPRDEKGNIDLLNKLRAQKAANDKPADTLTPAAPEAPATPDAADELQPVTVTGKRTQPQGQDKPGDAELGRLLNLAGANTYDELNNYLKTGSTQAPAQPAAAKDDTLNQLQKDVDTVNQEPVDAAGEEPAKSEPAAEPAKADVKTSYQIRDPNTGRTRPVSKEKYDSMVSRNQIDTNIPLDYAFKVRNPNGDIETVTYKDNPERWSKIASQNAGTVGDLNTRLGAQLSPKETEPDVKGDGKSLFRKLFNIGKDDQGYYMGKKRGRDNAPEQEPEEIAESRKVVEKWAGDAKIKATGEYSGKTISQLQGMLDKINKSGPHERDSAEDKRRKQIQFAIRSKKDWKGGVKESEALNEKAVSADQQMAAGIALAAKRKGETPKKGTASAAMAKMSTKELEKFAKTKRTGLPKKKTDEAEIPSSGPDYGAGLGAGRSDKVLEAKPDFLDLDKDGNKKEPMKKAAADKKKQKVKESMNFKKLKAAYQEGYAHGLRELAARVKHYEDMEEAKQYFEGYKLGLEECYGLVPNRGLVGEESGHDIVDNMASFGAEEGSLAEQDMAQEKPQAGQVTTKPAQPQPSVATAMPQASQSTLNVGGVPATKPNGSSNMSSVMQSRANLSQMGQQAAQQQTNEDDLDESPFTWAAKNTPKGEKFKVGGKEFIKNDAFAFEDLDRQLNALLEDTNEVMSEGLSVSMSTGQHGSPDSVSVTATDDESAKLLDFIKQVGLGGLGGDKAEVVSPAEPAVAVVSDYGAPKFSGHEMPSMGDLLAKLTGVEDHGHDHHEHSHACNECGMMEEKCECEKEKVDESKKKLDENVLAMLPGLLRAGAGLTGAALQRAGAWAAANPVQATMLASHLASMMRNRNNDQQEVAETETLDQREEMVAEDDGEGYEQSQASAAEIDSALALGSQNEKSVTEQKAEDLLDMGDDYKPEFGSDMKNMLGKLDNISSNTSSNSYEVDGKPASKADYDKAMANFKMPDMPDMPNMPNLPDNTPADVKNMLAGTFKGLGQQMQGIKGKLGSMMGGNAEPYYKLSQADMDAILPNVDVTGKRVGGEKLPGDDELGRLLNLAGANTYDELASFLKSRKGNPVPPGDDQLEPVQVTGKRVPVPGSDDELQPVKVTSKKVPVPGNNSTDSDIDVKNMQAQLDAMMKDIMPRMNNRAQDQLDFDQEQSNLTRAAAGDWFRNKIGSGASLDNPRTQEKLNRLRDMKEETTDKMDQDAEKAGKKVAKDIEHDEGHKGKDDNKAEKAGQKVTKDIEYDDKKDREHDKLDEWANDAGKKGTDAQFTRDTNFMTNTIAGGLNKPKVTGQTTIPVIASQDARNGDEDVAAWKKLAGLEK